MSRNHGFLLYVAAEGVLFILSVVLYLLVPTGRDMIVVGGMVVLMIPGFVYHVYREKTIRKLSEYLTRVRNGHYDFEMRDYKEGELSILKSEIYKMTLMLTEQAELLQKDKVYLADAISDISHQLKTPITSILELMDLLKMANERYNETLVVITHDASVALHADRIITIEDGKIKKDEVIRGRGARGRQ